MSDQKMRTNLSMIIQAIRNEDLQKIFSCVEKRERDRAHVKLPRAREIISKRWNIAEGTFDNIRRGRRKSVGADLLQLIGAGLLSDLDSEIARLTHERQILIQSGFGPRTVEMHEVETVLQKVVAAYEALAAKRG